MALTGFLSGQQAVMKREEVNRRLACAVSRPIFGGITGEEPEKSRAVSGFLSSYDAKAVWVPLTRLDNYTPHFWQTFTGAVEKWNTDLARRLEKMDFPESLPDLHLFFSCFSRAAAVEANLLLLFENVHLLQQRPVLDFLEQLAVSAGENTAMLLLSGAEIHTRPPGNAPGRTACITDRQLRLLPEETGLYCAAQGILLTGRELEELQRYTGGWAFAVYLFSRYLRWRRNAPDPIEGAVSYLFDLLEREVFAPKPPRLKKLLLGLSLLDSFTPELAALLSDLPEGELVEYAEDNILLFHDLQSGGWRFQELFLQFLRSRQSLLAEEERQWVYRQAGEWHEVRGGRAAAIACYDRAGEYAGILRLLPEQGMFRISRDMARQNLRLLGCLPQEMVNQNPMVRVWQSSCHHSLMELDRAEAVLWELCTELEGSALSEAQAQALGEAHLLLAMYSVIRCNCDFVRHVQTAAQHLPKGSRLLCSGQRLLGNSNALAFTGAQPDALEQMLTAFEEAKPYARRVLGGCAYGLTELAAAEAHYYQGDSTAAERMAFQAVYGSRRRKQLDITCNGYFLLMRIAVACGAYKDAREHLAQLEALASLEDDAELLGIRDVAFSWFHMKLGRWQLVSDWIRSDELNRATVEPVNAGRDRVIRAGYLLVNRRYNELSAYMEDSMELCRQRGQRFMELKLQIISAVACHQSGDGEGAVRWLAQSYQWASSNRLTIPFAEMGRLMRSLTDYTRQRDGHGIPSEWLREINVKASTYAKYIAHVSRQYKQDNGIPPLAADRLSIREREALRYLCQGLTREEIGEELGLSANTMKALVKRVYNKLGVSSRAEAVHLATLEQLDS